ncbi:MAG TPA: PAS domain-containing protein [Anaerolineae bacterium]|nr:PAS domain-containing protein [Anaerolineae bacterium]
MAGSTALNRACKSEVLELLKTVGETVTATVGQWCEVVIHDLADLEHSIVFLRGDVTGREVGGHMTDFGLTKLRAGQTEPIINYKIYSDDGRTLRSSSIFIHDEDGSPIATFSIHLDITSAQLAEGFLRNLTSFGGDKPRLSESYREDVPEMVEAAIAEAAYDARKPISLMTKKDRVKMVAALEARGVFQLRQSVPLIAKRLGVTRKTIYNYLAELAGGTGSDEG